MRSWIGSLAVVALSAGCAHHAGQVPEPSQPAPLFAGLGHFHHAVATSSPDAQRYFDQGLTLAFAFNHAEAERSFRYAAKLDPDCAMCWWGVAFVLGPNINNPMDPAAAAPAWDALQKAQALAEKTTPQERGYIEALAARYAKSPPADRASLDQAFATAAGNLSRQYPGDFDAAAIYAEALMDLHPWDYYDRDGKPKRASTSTIVSTLESVLAKDPDHPWAIHLYIHATEASDHPERAEAFADKLGPMFPAAGHLVHMPGHTYMRVGRYHDAILANERATAADDSYVAQCHAQGVYPIGYVPHNHHFLWAAAGFAGNSEQALRSAANTESHVAHELLREPGVGPFLQMYEVQPLYAMVRFGKWQQILDTPAPPKDLAFPTALWHYARGRALTALGRLDDAGAELAVLTAIAASPELAKVGNVGFNAGTSILQVAIETLSGELEARRGNVDAALRHLEAGVKLEDNLAYNEPADWNYPVRQSLGAVLLAAGKSHEADLVYREDLRRNPANGWSLFGLAQSLEAQGRRGEAAVAREKFDRAWRWADVTLTASRF